MLQKILVVKDVVKKIIIRTLKLLFWGIVLQGYSHALDDLSYGIDKKQIPWRFPRILVYLVVALIETFTTKLRPTVLDPSHFFIFTTYKWQWLGAVIVFLIYMIKTYALYVLDWIFVRTLRLACNVIGYMDQTFSGINHLYMQPIWIHLKVRSNINFSPNIGHFAQMLQIGVVLHLNRKAC
ncbi:hypothetical protein CsSME_00031757 [Camellia sinensis var. sinensis]